MTASAVSAVSAVSVVKGRRLAVLFDPVFNNNPIALQILGICSALAVTSNLRTALVISIIRPDFTLSLSASGRPRSAKTLPELVVTSIPLTTRVCISHLLG